MCRNISNILFVLFAVVLGLAASEEEGSEILLSECYAAVKRVGDIICRIYGYNTSGGLTYHTCELGCGDKKVQLPKEACSNGNVHETCTRELKDNLQKWSKDMMERNEKIWCKQA
uniref:Putative ixodes 10 kDa peptide protein n=1 Tax=Ixodes ricinus TaxID=34613 RepID=A0A0K8RIS7_IXORI